MERMEMVEKLRERFDITMEEAKEVLERNEWDILNACIELEKVKGEKVNDTAEKASDENKEEKTEQKNCKRSGKRRSRISEAARSLIRMGIDNKLVITKDDAELAKIPVIIPIACFAAQLWLALIAAFAGLVFGLKYSFEGKELGKEVINNTMEKASEAANDFVNNLADKKDGTSENEETAEKKETVVEQ